jgi:hypothetical protein
MPLAQIQSLRACPEITALDGAEFLVVRKAREGERAEARDPSRNAADGQKDKPDDAVISGKALTRRHGGAR